MKRYRIIPLLALAAGIGGTMPGEVHAIELRRHVDFAQKAELKNLRQSDAGRVLQTAQAEEFVMPLDNTWIKLVEPGSTPFTFSGQWVWDAPGAVTFTVTDWLWSGDWFEVFDNGVMLGEPLTSGTPNHYAAEPDDALGKSPQFSQHTWVLPAGTHKITIRSIKKAPTFGDATVAFRAQRVPDGGSTFWMLGVALAGLRGLSRLTRPGPDLAGAS